MKKLEIGFIVDPLDKLKPAKDTSIALMKEVAKRGGRVFAGEIGDLLVEDQKVFAWMHELELYDEDNWYSINRTTKVDLNSLEHVWLRKEPPFESKYLYATYILDLVVLKGGKVFNNPSAIRRFNEKIFALRLNCAPESIVSSNKACILQFLERHSKIVIKSLDSYGGKGVLLVDIKDLNKETIINIMTSDGSIPVMVQKYIPEIINGDKRVLIINGQPYPKTLVRIPKDGDLRGNLDAGATVVLADLTSDEFAICEEITPTLRQEGIFFAGIDIIGNYCTEINITSPTCVKELEKLTGENIASKILSSVLE
jgi:glutathione synthase